MRPIYAYGHFIVLPTGDFHQIVVYEYADAAEELASAVESRRDSELRLMRNNMQSFLDEEVVRINGVEVKPRVVLVNVGFRGSLKRPFIEFLIHFKGDLVEGINTYENIYNAEIAEYDYSVTWLFPPGFEVVEVDVGTDFKIEPPNVLKFRVEKGFKTPGYERICFRRLA